MGKTFKLKKKKTMENYYLHKNYVHRLDNQFFDDTPYKDQYQDDVYSSAKDVVDREGYTKLIDIGTGSGFKLMKYFNNLDTIGVDLEPTINFLKKTYPSKKWSDLASIDGNIEYDLIICSDVIEHIPEPNKFINEINKIKFKKIMFSTPDRLNMYGFDHQGPPLNPSHVREWSMDEFNKYISEFYNVEEHFKSSPNSNTQIILCSKKDLYA
jgi:2-polyprenyl-3-methyl-5-hydroxy-6-metoxy-1,4-benzoquinol methylase